MKPTDRDDLLIRIDERTRNIYTLTEKQDAHLSNLNDSIREHAEQITNNTSSIKWIRVIGWIVTTIIFGGGLVSFLWLLIS